MMPPMPTTAPVAPGPGPMPGSPPGPPSGPSPGLQGLPPNISMADMMPPGDRFDLFPGVSVANEQPREGAMTEEDLLGIVQEEVDWAIDKRDQRSAANVEALDYFYLRAPTTLSDTEDECHMSDLVSSDVQDAVYAVLAEIMPAFGGAAPVEFQPFDEQDVADADIETRATNHVAQSSGIYMALVNAVQDALLRRAGVVKVFWEDRVGIEYESFEGIPAMALLQKFAPQKDQTLEIVQGDVNEKKLTASGVLRKHKRRSKPRIDPVPMDEFLISADLATPNVEEARFIAHQRPVSRSELVEMGFDPKRVADLDKFESSSFASSARSRDATDRELRSAHESTEYVMVVESYYNIDWDGDGIAERRRIVTAGGADGTDELFANDPWFEQPFAVGVGYLGIYTWDGVSLFDRLKAIQDAKTSLIRDTVNTIRRNMRQRFGVLMNDANLDDVFTSVSGGVIRMRTPNGVTTIPDVPLPPVMFQLLEYLDSVRKDKGGGAIDATASAQILGQGGDWSLERMMAATEQINAMVAKNLVETLVKPVYRKLHALLREYQQQPISLPGSTGWQATLPAKWQPREDMVVTMGMSVGERTQRLGALTGILAHLAQDAQTGMSGILSDEKGIYNARVDMARLSGLPQPEQYYVDPQSPQAQQAKQSKQQQAAAQQQALIEQQQMTAELQYRMMTDLERIKGDAKIAAQSMAEQTKKMQTIADAMTKLFGHRVKLAEVEQKGDLAEAQREIDMLQYEAVVQRDRSQMNLARDKMQQEMARVTALQGTEEPTVVKNAEQAAAKKAQERMAQEAQQTMQAQRPQGPPAGSMAGPRPPGAPQGSPAPQGVPRGAPPAPQGAPQAGPRPQGAPQGPPGAQGGAPRPPIPPKGPMR